MGCCLGKIRQKRNRVSPSYMEADIRQRMSGKSTKRQTPDPENMTNQLNEADVEESKITKGGVSFTISFKTGDPTRMPSRLADQLDGTLTPNEDEKEVHYTASERELLAELFREDVLREKCQGPQRRTPV